MYLTWERKTDKNLTWGSVQLTLLALVCWYAGMGAEVLSFLSHSHLWYQLRFISDRTIISDGNNWLWVPDRQDWSVTPTFRSMTKKKKITDRIQISGSKRPLLWVLCYNVTYGTCLQLFRLCPITSVQKKYVYINSTVYYMQHALCVLLILV